MRFEHEFTLPVPVTQAWPVLLDSEQVVPCLPGATVTGVSGRDVEGKLRVRVGPVTVTYQGSARFTERDEDQRRAVISARAKEARGGGTAKATITAQLHDEGGHTRVGVRTDLVLTGRLAQSGRSALNDAGARMVSRFADRLADLLADDVTEATEATDTAPAAGSAAPTGVDRSGDRHAEPVHADPPVSGTPSVSGAPDVAWPAPGSGDALPITGRPATRRWAPALAVLVLLVLLFRRRRHR